jgi:N-acetyl-gamma-glutamyl-phosphate reductase
MKKYKIGIVGATGYTGTELIRLLWDHPGVSIDWITSQNYIGKKISEVFPHLVGKCELIADEYSVEKVVQLQLDLVFLALPHGLAHSIVPALIEKKIKVVDLGADYRFKDTDVYERYYVPHTSKQLTGLAVYGMPELKQRDAIKKAALVANPGCYVTASTLALKPLVDAALLRDHSVIIDAKSGVTGAGRKLALASHFCESHGNFSAYNLTKHRHQPEIEQNVGMDVVFSPHLLPVDRGILVTVYADLTKTMKQDALMTMYRSYYDSEPFVKVVDHLPGIKEVVGTNDCAISIRVDERMNKVIIVSVIDNLVKGASGQAVQNMNLMLGFEETQNLQRIAIYP